MKGVNIKKIIGGIVSILILSCGLSLYSQVQAQDEQLTSKQYVNKAWAKQGERDFEAVYKITQECIDKYGQQADKMAQSLNDFPPKGKEGEYQVMNDVATCYFIRAEALMRQYKEEKAQAAFKKVIERYPYAQAWDPRGWFWSIKEKAQASLKKLETGKVSEEEESEEVVITKVKLHDVGDQFPVDYEKYGKFVGVGTEDYKYEIEDPVGLAEAVGEGIYPNSNSVKFDPNFVKQKKQLFSIDHWEILNSRDLSTAFYKWTMAPEPPGVQQFYIADILERSGQLRHAIKAYYAVLVHFPQSYGWSYWQTPWYIGKVALYRLKHILRSHPELGLKLEGAFIKVKNGFDNSVRDDLFVVNPGKLVETEFLSRIRPCPTQKRKLGPVKQIKGKGDIKIVQYESGDWQLQLKGEPFMVRAITYSPTRVGESPDEGTLENWTTQDINDNDIIDSPYESWVDANENNKKDANEKKIGDFKLMADMGVNAIRLYHQPFKLNKELLRQMYEKYGIYVLLGDYFGKYAIGSGASWEEGTDYDNAVHKKNMLESIKKMVNDFKDEPYILMWLIGNENVYGLGCNADKKPASFFKFANEAAKLIKKLDPQKRPVAVVSGDVIYLDVFAEHCPDVDIFGTNAYRGHYGFLGLWDDVRRIAGKPAMITEYGCSSYAKGYSKQEGQKYQARYHKNAWGDIMRNSAGYGAGNAIGGIVFEWLDEWWKAYEPGYHDKKGLFAGPFLDGYMHEEWLGVCSQGDGKHSPFLRRLKKSYHTYQDLWNN
jgi:beta-glucuronidase